MPHPWAEVLWHSPLPDQQDYKCLTKLNALGVGWAGWTHLDLPRLDNEAFFEQQYYLRFDSCKIAHYELEEKLKFIFI